MAELQCVFDILILLLFLALVSSASSINDRLQRIHTILFTAHRDEMLDRIAALEAEYEEADDRYERHKLKDRIKHVTRATLRD